MSVGLLRALVVCPRPLCGLASRRPSLKVLAGCSLVRAIHPAASYRGVGGASRRSNRSQGGRVQAASGGAIAAATATWWGWSAVALALYAGYWAILRRVMPAGKPISDVIDSDTNPALARLFVAVAMAELAVVFFAPWFAGAPATAAKYFAPIALMTAVNIFLEGAFRRRGHVLAVYSSTGANNLWRLCAYFAALLEMAATPLVATPRLRVVAWAGVVISVAIVLIFEPVVARSVPLYPGRRAGEGR